LVVYEGESALLSIVDHERKGKPLNHDNVYSKLDDFTENREHYYEKIETLPMEDFSDFSKEEYYPFGQVSLPIYVSKGCSWCKCSFCCVNQSRNHRERDIDFVVENLVKIVNESKIRNFDLDDEEINPVRLKLLSEKIIENSLNIKWSIQTRFYPQLTKEILLLFQKAGGYSIEFGLESASDKTLRMVHKGISLEVAEKILSDCADVGIEVILNCMIGFPNEQKSDALQLISFLDKIHLKIPNLIFKCNTQLVKIYKNSDFGINPSKYGIEGLKTYDLSPIMYWKRPDWVQDFAEEYRHHILFNQKQSQVVSQSHKKTFDAEKYGDPFIMLSSDWEFIDVSKYELVNELGGKAENSEAKYYLVEISNGINAFKLTETMAVLAKLMIDGKKRISTIKQEFVNRFSEFPEREVLEVLGAGLILLNSKGVINYYEN